MVYRLKYQGQVAAKQGQPQVAQAEDFKWKYVRDAFSDWQIWVNILVYWGVSFLLLCGQDGGCIAIHSSNLLFPGADRLPLCTASLFLPTIINNLGYTSSTAQLMTVPIYITAAILAVIIAYLSDRVGRRSSSW